MEDRMYGALRIDPFDFPAPETDLPADGRDRDTAVIAGGCFWCTEAVYVEVDGVLGVRSGYAGGTPETADYRTVCSGTTGHAEAIEVTYDPRKISYGTILKLFFSIAHDPTQLNRQGNDVGTQYRSAIFYHSDDQQGTAAAALADVEAAGLWDGPVVTELAPLAEFYPAEGYHDDYFLRNPSQPYCQVVVAPKVAKVRSRFFDKLRRDRG
jgi:peptide-methionine (S)-S-oxide reductase